jgi:hypothetical protein
MRVPGLGKWVEMGWPWIAASLVAAFIFRFNDHFLLPHEVASRLVDKLVDFCSIGVGFWATALALLLALEGRKTVEGLKTLDIYGQLVGYFLSSVYAFFALLILCLTTIAVGRPSWVPHRLAVAFWGFILTFTGSSMLRSFHLLGKLLKSK